MPFPVCGSNSKTAEYFVVFAVLTWSGKLHYYPFLQRHNGLNSSGTVPYKIIKIVFTKFNPIIARSTDRDVQTFTYKLVVKSRMDTIALLISPSSNFTIKLL